MPENDGDTFSSDLKVTVNGKPVNDLKIYSDHATFSISYTVKNNTLRGDVNGDGKVDVSDITKIAAHIKGKKLLAGDQKLRADVNDDGKVDVSDITKIAAHIKGKKLLF